MARLLSMEFIHLQYDNELNCEEDDDMLLDWATDWREIITDGLHVTFKEGLMDMRPLREENKLYTQKIGNDIYIEENDVDIDCDDEAQMKEYRIYLQRSNRKGRHKGTFQDIPYMQIYKEINF